jgi:hypothetical protein
VNDREKINQVIALITEDSSLRPLIKGAPEAIVMPFANERQKRYIAVSFGVTEEAVKRDTVASICKRVVEVLRSSNLLGDVDGLEIMLGAPYAGRMRRILRLGILSDAIIRAGQLTSEDIELPEPAPGITCTRYQPLK